MIGKRGIIRVEHGKGGKERNIMLSGAVARDPGGLLEAGAIPDLVVSEPGGTVRNSVREP
ncbi:hypothetical protein [Sinorhizobium meliloti]|uniref:hypothetical protein n=1 Tax=Rhizobium meliloti TaxID=382 RepID=UPI001F413620|nr:hypothetical protein [Sinorhizobium meliloti]